MSLRLIFMGTPDFSVPTLTALTAHGHKIVACYTQPPRPAGRRPRARLGRFLWSRPGLVLVHMDPTSGAHRGNWPGEFLQLLVDSDWNVLVLDRRGAGGSGGVAADAFQTTKGAFDIEAAVISI